MQAQPFSRSLIGFGIAASLFAALLLGRHYYQTHSKFDMPTCRIDITYVDTHGAVLQTESIWRSFLIGDRHPEETIDKAVVGSQRLSSAAVASELGLPSAATNWDLVQISSRGIYGGVESCVSDSKPMTTTGLVYLNLSDSDAKPVDHTSWTEVRVSQLSNGSYLMRTTWGQDYIEIFLTEKEMEHLLKRALGAEKATTDIFVTMRNAEAEDIKSDGSRPAARFRWSTTTSKEDVLQSLAKVLQLKWELDVQTKQEAAMFVVTDTGSKFSTNEVLTGDGLQVPFMDAATNEASAVSGALYAR